MDVLRRSASMSESTIPAELDTRLSASMRETRIRGALDHMRSLSSMSYSETRSLSIEEEDELQGKAGDSGSAHRFSTEGNYTSGDFSMNLSPGVDFNGLIGAGPKVSPVDADFDPISRVSSDSLHRYLELISVLAYLTTFGILGVLIRYLLEVLFDQNVVNLTSNRTALFIDLPANMLGSFFMGWVGVVFKKPIGMYSEHLAVGLSTGLMGSITTYAAMMQRNLAIVVSGKWVIGLAGLLIGVFLAQMALVVGEDTARLLLEIIHLVNHGGVRRGLGKWKMPPPDNLKRRKIGLVIFVFLGGGLWAASIVLTMVDRVPTSRRTLWLACWLAPPGVWTRWYLARLNGQGIGRQQHQRWFPVGTFLVNVAGSSLEAGLTTVELAAGNYMSTLLVGAINLGTLGCLSTVSTFAVEIEAMHGGGTRWRSYAYPIISMAVSLIIGILVYGVPVWSKAVAGSI